jgi:murein L,D-transpeptidase YafK
MFPIMRFRWLGILIVLGMLSLMSPVLAADLDMADRVLIKKAERKLFLMKNDKILKSVDISLGLVPTGDKQSEGDFRTPEGRYKLTERNTGSDFFLSIKISYPNGTDNNEAGQLGLAPGGQIMIHGQPNDPSHSPDYYRWTDWTDGCVAVSNSNMVDIWLMTNNNTPIEILP